jgi:hypothetical protein
MGLVSTGAHTYQHSKYEYYLIVKQIEEPLVSPHSTFAQIYQLKEYGQYNMRESIVNIHANLDLVQKCFTTLTLRIIYYC